MNILLYTLKAVASAITEPYLAIILVIIAFVLYRKNSKIAMMQKMIIGEQINSPMELTISQVVIGILAGTVASMILSYFGVAFDENSAIDIIFLLSVIFMLWNPRFVCFSYSGAALGFISLFLENMSRVLNKPGLNFLKIDVAALMTMVAVLHFIEGILVISDGKRGSIPVFTSRDNKIVGGFAFQRYWVLPVALLLISHDASIAGDTVKISTSGGWPLLKDFLGQNLASNLFIILYPFYGMIGYSSITFTKNKSEKTLFSGLSIILYSIVLFIFSRLAVLNIYYKILVLIFAPLAHELMINFQKYIEIEGKPKFVSSDEGIMVLDVAPNSPADEMGIKSGDMLVEVNDKIVESEEDILTSIKETSSFIWFKIKRATGKLEEISYTRMNNEKCFGVVLVPKGTPKDSIIVKLDSNRFKDVLDKIRNKDDNNE